MKEITVAELKNILADVSLVDVREPDEYTTAHVPGAKLIPLATVPVRMNELDVTQTHYLICKVGGRSAQAGQFLEQQGFDVVNVVGGTDAWVESGEAFNTGEQP